MFRLFHDLPADISAATASDFFCFEVDNNSLICEGTHTKISYDLINEVGTASHKL